MKFVVFISFCFTVMQYLVTVGYLPSIVKPFNIAHEDLLFWISVNTYFVVVGLNEIHKVLDNR